MPRKISRNKPFKNDLSSWNFILFLTLAFILLVVVLTLMKNVSQDVRTRAGLECPQLTPRVEDCSTGSMIYKRDPTTGCLSFTCTVPTPTPTK